MASQKQQYTILYGRLSQEDERAGESNSIQHQRDLLEKYARDKGFENTLFLADDGYSGTNFERPSWKKIVEMIEAGEVSTLIVKDASRLGREYLQVGYYMEIYFPQKNVRFIAVNDGVDSAVESSNDFNPIRNWANELHAKDTSRKVRAVKKLQAERGERLGGKPPYGYRCDPADKDHWILDEDAAPIVKYIFDLTVSGKGPDAIARILEDQKVLTTKALYAQRKGKPMPERPYHWAGQSVAGILERMEYTGCTCNFKIYSKSYKLKQRIPNSPEDMFILPDTQDAIVSQAQWDRVQERLKLEIEVTEEWLETQETMSADVDAFVALTQKYVDVQKLTPTIVNEYIKKIEVFPPDKSSGKRVQKVKIYFNFVDDVEIPVISEPVVAKSTPGRRKTA